MLDVRGPYEKLICSVKVEQVSNVCPFAMSVMIVLGILLGKGEEHPSTRLFQPLAQSHKELGIQCSE